MHSARMLRLIPRDDPDARVGDPPMADEEIVERLGTRDARAARQLYARVYDPVDAALCRVLGFRGADHEDLMQRTFELLFTTLVQGRFAFGCSLGTWASAIAGRVALASLRARRREHRVIEHNGEVAERAEVAGRHDVERETIARSELGRVTRVLGELSPEQAEALVLHDVLGHGLVEIAALTGVTVAAAQSRLVRGRKQFRERSQRGGR
jgi:RNA polymerase sigma-70 factor, ECF subfamily